MFILGVAALVGMFIARAVTHRAGGASPPAATHSAGAL
jgi:hypothetical protein